jgi:hypothetical protein
MVNVYEIDYGNSNNSLGKKLEGFFLASARDKCDFTVYNCMDDLMVLCDGDVTEKRVELVPCLEYKISLNWD